MGKRKEERRNKGKGEDARNRKERKLKVHKSMLEDKLNEVDPEIAQSLALDSELVLTKGEKGGV